MKKHMTTFSVAGMVIIVALIVANFSSTVRAETDYIAVRILNDIRQGRNNQNQIQTLRVRNNATIGGNTTIGGNLTVDTNLTVGGSFSPTGDITLANGETIDNATDGEVRVTYDDNAALLGELKLESDNVTTNIDANDNFRISARAFPSNSTTKIDVGRYTFVIVTPASNAVATAQEAWVNNAGTLQRIMLISTAGVTCTNGGFNGDGNGLTNLNANALAAGSVAGAIDIRATTGGTYAALSSVPFTFAVTNDVSGGTNNQVTYYTNGLAGSVVTTP